MTVAEYFIKYPDDRYGNQDVIHVRDIHFNMICFQKHPECPEFVERYNDMIIAFNLRPND
jgi:hypothetical protein